MARAGSPRLATSSSWTEVGWSKEGSRQGPGKEEQFGPAACPEGQGERVPAAGSSRSTGWLAAAVEVGQGCGRQGGWAREKCEGSLGSGSRCRHGLCDSAVLPGGVRGAGG